MDEITQRAYLVLLFDFYGALLTKKQKQVFDLYYQNDLSLAEIAEGQGISRQAVYDLLKRTENILLEYEDKLALVEKFSKTREKIERAIFLIDNEDVGEQEKLIKLRSFIQGIIKDF